VGGGEVLQCLFRVRNADYAGISAVGQRSRFAKACRIGNHDAGGASSYSIVEKVMAVESLPAQRDKNVAGLNGSRIGTDAAHVSPFVTAEQCATCPVHEIGNTPCRHR
jgi:hypothetical protein